MLCIYIIISIVLKLFSPTQTPSEPDEDILYVSYVHTQGCKVDLSEHGEYFVVAISLAAVMHLSRYLCVSIEMEGVWDRGRVPSPPSGLSAAMYGYM